MKRTALSLLMVAGLAVALGQPETLRAENAGGARNGQAPAAAPGAAPKYTSQTYVDTLKAELERFKVRLERDKADAKIKTPLDTAIADGNKLLGIVEALIKAKKNLDTNEFLTAAATYLQSKKLVPISWDDETAHLTAWIEANKSDVSLDGAIKYYDQILILLKKGKEAFDKGNKMETASTQNQFNQRASTADSYHKAGSYKGLGPDTHRGEYILARLQTDPNVTIQTVIPNKPDMSNPQIRNRVMGN